MVNMKNDYLNYDILDDMMHHEIYVHPNGHYDHK